MNRRVIVRKPGGPDVLEGVEEAEPTPEPGEVKVRILASGVAYGDLMLRAGVGRRASGYPVTPGYDFVGVVDALGEGSRKYAVGDQVAGFPVTGGYQQFICLPETELISVPPNLDPAEAVSVILNYLTADQMLTRLARLNAGDTALIHGAAGGVGTAMLELARLRGVKLYGTVSAGKMNVVRELGGVPIDYQSTDFVQELRRLEPGGVRAVFDPVGGAQLSRSSRVLARGGTLVMFGASSATKSKNPTLALIGSVARLLALRLRPDGKNVRWYFNSSIKTPHVREDLAALLGLLAEGKLRPRALLVLPLREARQAHELLEGAKVTGKIVLRP